MKLKNKILVIPAIFTFALFIILLFFKIDITKNINKLLYSNTPKLISILEVEINLEETHVSLYNILNSYDRDTIDYYKERYKDSISDQQKYLSELKRLSINQEEKANLILLDKNIKKYLETANNILVIDKQIKELIQKRRDILNNNIEVDLDLKLQKNLNKNDKQYLQKQEALLEVEINIHELISSVRGYIIKNDKFLLDRVKDSEEDIVYWTDKLNNLFWNIEEQKTLNNLNVELIESYKLSDKIISNKLQQEKLLEEYKQLDIKLDDLIDNVINVDVIEEQKLLNSKLLERLDLSVFLLLTMSLIILIIMYKTATTLLQSINHIIDEIKNKIFSKETTSIEINTKDEIELLGNTINEMSLSIHESSLEKTEFIHELNKLNHELEIKIDESDKKEEILSKYILFSRTDTKGIIIDVSEFFCNLSGYSKKELIGSPHSIIRHPEMPHKLYEEMWSTIKGGEVWKGEIKNKAKDGHYYWVSATVSPEYDRDGKINGYVSIREDITAKKDFDKQQLLLIEQAKMAAMGEMIGNIAHQWRQPLNAITVASSSIEVKYEMNMLSNKELHEFTRAIDKHAQYLSKTIDIFQNFIKDEKVLKEEGIENEISQAVSIAMTTLKSNHIELKDNINYDNPTMIKMTTGELPPVLLNIINNAKDIILERKIQDGCVELNLEKLDDKIIITAEDNAGGIPENILTKIFEPYFSTKHQSQGTGLGLHMSYKIITESFNGRLYVENTKNGAKFFIEIPIN